MIKKPLKETKNSNKLMAHLGTVGQMRECVRRACRARTGH